MDSIQILFNYWLHHRALASFIFDVFFASGFFILLALLISFIFSNQSKQAHHFNMQNKRLEDTQQSIQTLTEDIKKLHKRYHLSEIASSKLQQRLTIISNYISDSSKQQTAIESNQDLTYQFAAKLLHEGHNMEEVIKQCGLTVGEVEVLNALQNHQHKRVEHG